MITILSTVISVVAFRFRRRASLELELIGLRHQVSVLRRLHQVSLNVRESKLKFQVLSFPIRAGIPERNVSR